MVRSGKNPNLVESMFNSAGANIFTQVRWDGPAKVKNYMDGLLAPALQIQAELALAANPDYFTSSQEDKEEVLSIVRENAKAMVIRQMESGGAVPQSMDIVRKLARDKKTTEKVIDLLPFEFGSTDNFDSKMETILDMEDGYQQLLKIKSMVDTYDEWSSTVKEF
jgi:translation initiation factor 2 beta subunit (eIF-2beta)/eIF-5